MTRRLFVAWFRDEDGVRAAAATVREAGLRIHDVYTPYAVHGLDEAMGLRPSRLTWVCLGCGLAGLVIALGFQWWSSAVDWPLNVAGKPANSLPAFIPVAFELTVLLAGLGSVAALLWRTRLYPRWSPPFLPAGVTDDRFALALEADVPGFDEPLARLLCESAGAETMACAEATA